MKRRRFDKIKAVRGAAREIVGTVPPTRRVPLKTRKQEKYKPTLKKLLEEQ